MTTISPHDDIATLLAAGVLAYVTETLLHEAGGHGGACLAEGHRFLVLAPLWMRCSESDGFLTAAGPAMNVLAAAGFLTALRIRRPVRAVTGLLLWLGFAFNALVAFGYLGVGAATGFGDWPILFGNVSPQWVWRVPAMVVAVGGYYGCLRISAWLYAGIFGGGVTAVRDLRRRALLPSVGAASVACLAEIVGRRIAVMPLLLALGCTVVIGYSLTSMDDVVAKFAPADGQCIARSYLVIAVGLSVAAVFVLIVGPGLKLD